MCSRCVIAKSRTVFTEENTDEWIECRVCGLRGREIARHVKTAHEIDPKDYGVTKSKSSIDRVKGENNPGYQHGGKLSPWSKKSSFYSEESHKKAIEKSQEGINKNSPVRKSFYATEDEFRKAQTRDLDYFIAKYGVEKGTEKHKQKTLKWLSSYKKQNFSNISQELFRALEEKYQGNTFFATKDRPEMDSYTNKEFRTEIGILPDYIDIDKKRIIEFDGDYWHGRKGNVERDAKRDSKLMSAGYSVLHIKESDFKADKEGTIDRCIKFLTQ